MSVPEDRIDAGSIEAVSALLRGEELPRTASEDAAPDGADGVVTKSADAAEEAAAEEAARVDTPEDAPEAETQEGDAQDAEDAALNEPGMNMRDLAERLDMPEQDVWDSLHIPMGEGRSLSVTELRDAALHTEHIEGAWAEFDEASHARELEFLEQRREIEGMMRVFQEANIPPEVVERARGRHEDYQDEQFRILQAAWPEMAQEEYRAEMRPKLQEVGRSLGYSKAEVATITDARALLALREIYQHRERAAGARRALKEAGKGRAERSSRARGGRRGASPPNEQTGRQAGASSRDEQIAGVTALLNRS